MSLLTISSCYYHDSDPTVVQNVILYNKSVPTIKSYLAGKWKLNYKIGRLSGNQRTDYFSTFYDFEFLAVDTFSRIDSGKVTINSPISWLKFPVFANDSIYVIEYKLPNGVELAFYPKEIKSGVLDLVEPCPDCYSYFLMRAN